MWSHIYLAAQGIGNIPELLLKAMALFFSDSFVGECGGMVIPNVSGQNNKL